MYYNKIKSNKGASLFISLIFFLLATMISMVIMTTAATALKRVHDDRTQEQNRLSINSSVKILTDFFKDSKCQIQITTTTIKNPDGTIKETDTETVYTGSGTFGENLESLIKEADDVIFKDKKHTFKINAKDENGVIPIGQSVFIFTIDKEEQGTGLNINGVVVPTVINYIIKGTIVMDSETNDQKVFLNITDSSPETITTDYLPDVEEADGTLVQTVVQTYTFETNSINITNN